MNKKRIAIFGATSSKKPFSPSTKMFNLLEQYGDDDYSLLYYEDVVFELQTGVAVSYIVAGDGRRTLLESFDTIYLRAMDNELVRAAIGLYCSYKNIRVLNSENAILPLTSKLSQYVVASFNNVSIPKTFFSLNKLHWDLANEFLDTDANEYIIKSISGANGRDNIKVNNLNVDVEVDSVIQEFIANSYEYRVIVLGKQVALAYKKVNTGSGHQNNIARGGRRELIQEKDLPSEVREYAIKMADLSNREIAGVDVVSGDDGSYRFFEVNYSYGHPAGLDEEALKLYGKSLARELGEEI